MFPLDSRLEDKPVKAENAGSAISIDAVKTSAMSTEATHTNEPREYSNLAEQIDEIRNIEPDDDVDLRQEIETCCDKIIQKIKEIPNCEIKTDVRDAILAELNKFQARRAWTLQHQVNIQDPKNIFLHKFECGREGEHSFALQVKSYADMFIEFL